MHGDTVGVNILNVIWWAGMENKSLHATVM